jgi:hypothetical protein
VRTNETYSIKLDERLTGFIHFKILTTVITSDSYIRKFNEPFYPSVKNTVPVFNSYLQSSGVILYYLLLLIACRTHSANAIVQFAAVIKRKSL